MAVGIPVLCLAVGGHDIMKKVDMCGTCHYDFSRSSLKKRISELKKYFWCVNTNWYNYSIKL